MYRRSIPPRCRVSPDPFLSQLESSVLEWVSDCHENEGNAMSRKALLAGFVVVALGIIGAGIGLTCLQQAAPGTDATSTSNAVGSSRLDIPARLPSPTNSLTSNRPTTSTAPWKGRARPGLLPVRPGGPRAREGVVLTPFS